MSDLDILKENGFIVESTRNPFIIDRVNNANRLMSGKKVIINPRCKYLIDDLNKVSWKDNKIYPGVDKLLGHIKEWGVSMFFNLNLYENNTRQIGIIFSKNKGILLKYEYCIYISLWFVKIELGICKYKKI